jgi:VirE-like protein
MFTSPTGTGLKVIVPIAPDLTKHEEGFLDTQYYFKEVYGLDIDTSCRNPSRLCFPSYDPKLFSRPNAEIIPPRPPNFHPVLAKKHGQPYFANGKGGFQVNQMYFVARFAKEHLVLHEPNERDFYIYDPATGAWLPHTSDAIKAMFSDDWERYANDASEPGLLPIRTNGLMNSFTSLLRGHVERPEAFTRTGRIIHLQNGMLHILPDGGGVA